MAGPLTLFREADAAKKLLVSPRTLARWRGEGRGPAWRKLGKIVAYAEADLAEFVEQARRTSTGERPAA